MRLLEYQAKAVLRPFGVAVPEGGVAYTPAEAHEVAAQLGGRVVIKAQVLAPGRARAGGVRLVSDPEEAELAAQEVMSLEIGGLPVKRLLVERAVDIARELYIGLALQTSGEVVLAVSGELAPFTAAPRTVSIDTTTGLLPFQVRDAAYALGLGQKATDALVQLATSLWQAMGALDALWIEINPVALLPTEELVAVDVKLMLDDNALYRHPQLAELREAEEHTQVEAEARRHGLYYVGLDGDIGSLVNGAGLAMATSDAIEMLGGRSANILDVAGGARALRVAAGMNILLRDERLHAILVNVFGGITRCDEVAAGILASLACNRADVPIFVRLTGTNAAQGCEMLQEAPVHLVPDLVTGARMAVAAARERQQAPVERQQAPVERQQAPLERRQAPLEAK
ncbi:MAG: succinate--CoA ligase subunit beta [Anaerolineae bacterium]